MSRAMLLAVAALVACSPVARDQLTRDAARSVVNRVVVSYLPDFPVEPAIDCVIDNATGDELLSLASEAVTGPTAQSTQTVTAIAMRPPTLQCLATKGLPAVAAQPRPGAAG